MYVFKTCIKIDIFTQFSSTRHLAIIVKMFEEYGSLQKTEFFGTYRVDLIVSLFSRVRDIHNFEIVMHCLTPREAACVYCRIGW